MAVAIGTSKQRSSCIGAVESQGRVRLHDICLDPKRMKKHRPFGQVVKVLRHYLSHFWSPDKVCLHISRQNLGSTCFTRVA